jgi:hypothetical protein
MASSLGVMREQNQIIRLVLPLMAVVTCLTTGAASAATAARPSDTDPHDSSGRSAAARDDDTSSFDPFDPFDDLRPQADSLPDDRALKNAPADSSADNHAQAPANTAGGSPPAPHGTAPHALPATLRGSAPTTGNLTAVGAHLYKGWGFDVCSAPSLSTMRAWRHSGYGAIGVYIGGRSRNCSQPHLSREWVRSVNDMGWKILPIFVGSQAPCATNLAKRRHRIDVDDPEDQGMDEGDDAARDANRLGLARSSPVFLDMEAYRTRSESCTESVISFTQAWSHTLREHGYLPGFYSSADSGIRQIEAARRADRRDLPELIWFARWEVDPTIYGEPRLARSAWRPHRRIHQFDGEVRERHGGRRLTIDSDYIDSPVAIVKPKRRRSSH